MYLGVGGAAPAWGRGLPAIAIIWRGDIFLFDAGEGTQARLAELGLSPHRVRLVAVTHLHGDHFFGLPGLLQFMTLSGRRDTLVMVGPRGLDEYIAEAERITGHVRSFDIAFSAVREGVVYEDENLEIRGFKVCHGLIESYGYVFRVKEAIGVDVEKLRAMGLSPGPYLSRLKRGEAVEVGGRVIRPEDVLTVKRPEIRIVYTGDTRPCASVVEAARGARLLIHDSTFADSEIQDAMEKGHSTAGEAGRVANDARVEWLALFHISARYRNTSTLVADAKRWHRRVYAPLPGTVHPILV